MKCEICKKVQGKRYIAFPESDHLTEEIMVLWICKRCKPNWYKALDKFKTGDIVEVLSRRRCPKCTLGSGVEEGCSKYIYRLRGDSEEVCGFAVEVSGAYELDEILGL